MLIDNSHSARIAVSVIRSLRFVITWILASLANVTVSDTAPDAGCNKVFVKKVAGILENDFLKTDYGRLLVINKQATTGYVVSYKN